MTTRIHKLLPVLLVALLALSCRPLVDGARRALRQLGRTARVTAKVSVDDAARVVNRFLLAVDGLADDAANPSSSAAQSRAAEEEFIASWAELGIRTMNRRTHVAQLNRYLKKMNYYDDFELVLSAKEISKPEYVRIDGPVIAGGSASYLYLRRKKRAN